MRRTVAVFCWLVVFPFTASALGLGEISLNSALNQPFSAEIPVDSYAESDLKGLKVALASEATFDRYGLDQPAFLQGFEFSVAKDNAGAPIVRVSSLRPVSEPFVTLLLDIRWASGRLLREYTVLLDPPLFESEPVRAAVATPAVTSSAESAQSDAAGEVVRNSTPRSEASSPSASTSAAPVSTRTSESVSRVSSAPSQPALNGSYSVQRRDTLWGIADRVRGDSDLTMNQVMLALYRANPEAFLGNINRLKAGAILRVPEKSQLAQLTAADATAAVREQNAAASQGSATAPAAQSEPARLTLVAPTDDVDASQSDAGQLGASTEGAAAALDAVADRVAGEQLQGRIGELESELSESNRLIEARDAELAALQRRIQVLESREDLEATDSIGSDELLADDGVLIDADTARGAAELTEDPLFADEAAAEDLDPVNAGAAEQAADPAADSVGVVPARESESSFFGDLLGSLWFWISAGVVLLLALFVARRRQSDIDDDFDADATGGGWQAAAADADHEETMRDLEAVEVEKPEDSIVVEESSVEAALAAESAEDVSEPTGSFLESDIADQTAQLTPIDEEVDAETPLEKTISTGPLDLDQADPVAEAEFHMAYGLYDQAAELLETALKSEPDNRGFLVKLIEVFFVWENRDGFLKHATTLRENITDDGDSDWNKVLILGKQLCPDEAIFTGAAAASPAADSMDFEISDAGDTELDFSLGSDDALPLSEDAADGSDDSAVADADLDFDLGSDFDGGDDDIEIDLGGADDTLESPTVETDLSDGASYLGGDTLETPTIESPAVSQEGMEDDLTSGGDAEMDLDLGEDLIDDSASTMESPTVESSMNGPTLESPTLEAAPVGGDTTEMPALDASAFDTEGVDLDLGGAEDLDVDLSGLSDEVDDPEESEPTLMADAGDMLDDGASEEDETLLADSGDLEDEIEAELSAQSEAGGNDTVEQPQIDASDVELGETAEQPALVETGNVDFDLGTEADADEDEDLATAIQEASLPEDATMTEVGTKLDLARAYIDMGDPDGARSILTEVLDEGADEQQQEARQLLEELGD